MSYLRFKDDFSAIIFDDEVMRHYFRSCNVAPIWLLTSPWGKYYPEFNNGTGVNGMVRFNMDFSQGLPFKHLLNGTNIPYGGVHDKH